MGAFVASAQQLPLLRLNTISVVIGNVLRTASEAVKRMYFAPTTCTTCNKLGLGCLACCFTTCCRVRCCPDWHPSSISSDRPHRSVLDLCFVFGPPLYFARVAMVFQAAFAFCVTRSSILRPLRHRHASHAAVDDLEHPGG